MWLAVRYRRLQALMFLALSALITASAVLAPLYYRAMQQALTHLAVAAAPASATAIQIRSLSRFTSGLDPVSYNPASLSNMAALLPENARNWFRPQIDSTSLLVVRADQKSTSPVGELLWRDGSCDHVVWTAGACPAARGDVAISGADAKNFKLAVGTTVDVVESPQVSQDEPLPTVRLRVTGIYQQSLGEYWDGRLLGGLSGFVNPSPPYRPSHDTWLTAPATFSGAGGPRWLDPLNTVTYNLDRGSVGVDRALRLGPLVTSIADRVAFQVDDAGNAINGEAVLADVQSGLPALSTSIGDGGRQALVTVPLLMIQLGLLTLFVLGLVLGVAVEQRRPEVALARLRGSGTKGARRLVLTELLPVVLAGVPVGIGCALALAALARRTVLGGAAPFELGLGFWAAIVGAIALLSAVTWLAAMVGTRDRISSLLRNVPARVHGWAPRLGDTVVVVGSATAVLAFATGGLRGPLALAAPALLALLVGLLLAHFIVPTATWFGRRLMLRGRYAAALAVLATARRPATRRVVTVITVASALLVFSSYAVSVGSRNRELAAQRDVGAAMVADVTGTDVSTVLSALAPVMDGHETPVVRISAAAHAYRTTLAVDPATFGKVALFPDAKPAMVPWSRLQLATGPRLTITGSAISMLLTPHSLSVSQGGMAFQLDLINDRGAPASVTLGTIPVAGPRTLAAPVPCAGGCTVVGLTVGSFSGVAYDGALVISQVVAAGGATNLPGTAADWRAGVDQLNRVAATADGPSGITLTMHNAGVSGLGIESRWLPVVLPTLVAGPSNDSDAGAVNGNGLNGDDRALASVGRLARAPGVDGPTAIVDLSLLQHWGNRVATSTRVQVWFDSESPDRLARVRAALHRGGVEISGVQRVSDVRHAYDASVPAWSLRLGILVAVVGVVIAALVLVLLVASTIRRRARDLACLGMSGVPRRGLQRAAVGEQLPIVLLAVLAGAGCGLLGAVLALPTVPLFALPKARSTLDLATPWGTVLVVLASELVVLGVVAWLCGRTVASRARLSRVRESL